jgi:large subunit ribosomal protein L25
MRETEILKAERRTRLGIRHARKLRAEGRIPATLPADAAHPHEDLHIDEHDFMASRRRHVHVFDVDLGGETSSAVVREVQWDTFGERIIHIEFKRVSKDVETESEVELEFVGHPKSGALNHLVTRITVLSIPALIPDSIEVRLANLEPGALITAGDLALPEGVKLAVPRETQIARIIIPKVVVAEPAAPAAAATPEAGAAAPATPAPEES